MNCGCNICHAAVESAHAAPARSCKERSLLCLDFYNMYADFFGLKNKHFAVFAFSECVWHGKQALSCCCWGFFVFFGQSICADFFDLKNKHFAVF